MTDENFSVGLGTWKITDRAQIKLTLTAAFEAGYKMIDTAAAYGNEISIGKVLKDFPREKFFIQGKVWRTCMGFEQALDACKKSLRKLKLDYFDSYLIHWPTSPAEFPNWEDINAQTWAALEKLQRDGLVRFIGVSNFKPYQIESLAKFSETMPQINQMEIHPGFFPREIISFCREKNIRVQAHSPLGNGQILENEVLKKIAASKGKTTAQISIRWVLDKGADVITKSQTPERIRENFNIFDFSLTEKETSEIDSLPSLSCCGNDCMIAGGEVVVFATGNILNDAYNAVNLLRENGIDAGLVNVYILNPFNERLFFEAVQTAKLIVSVEENNILGNTIAELLAGKNSSVRLEKISGFANAQTIFAKIMEVIR